MEDLEIELSADLTKPLQSSMDMLDRVYERVRRQHVARLGLTEMLVGHVTKTLKVHLQFREHSPPHFSIRHPEGVARFRIDNGERLPEDRDLRKYNSLIQEWYADNRDMLIEQWDASRPSDCPVGPIKASAK